MHIAHEIEVDDSSQTPVNTVVGMRLREFMVIRGKSLSLRDRIRRRLTRCLRTKKQVASTADMARRDMKEIAMIDHAEVSKLGMSHSSISVRPTYSLSTFPVALETKVPYIVTPEGFPATTIGSQDN